ncbi:MAG: hypothetical protein V1844_11545 [Pseudomonadota bacterium]
MIRRYIWCVRVVMAIALLILAEMAPGTAAEKSENEVIQKQVFTLGEVEVVGNAEEN